MAAAITPMVWADNHQGSLEHCAACGRKLKGTPRWVEVIDGGSSVAAPGLNPDTGDPGYMGWFPVGPECTRQHFKGFTSGGVR